MGEGFFRKLNEADGKRPCCSHLGIIIRMRKGVDAGEKRLQISGGDEMRKPHDQSETLVVRLRGGEKFGKKRPVQLGIEPGVLQRSAKCVADRPILDPGEKTADQADALFRIHRGQGDGHTGNHGLLEKRIGKGEKFFQPVLPAVFSKLPGNFSADGKADAQDSGNAGKKGGRKGLIGRFGKGKKLASQLFGGHAHPPFLSG